MTPNLDTSIFSVICELGNSLYTPEIDLSDMRRHQLIEDIRTGQFEKVRAILEFNPVEGWCSDITEDVLSAAFPGERNIEDSSETDWSDYRREQIDCRQAGIRARVAA